MTTTPQPDYYREADPELVPTYYGKDPYSDFLKTEGVPVVEAYSVDCVKMDLEPWPRLGGRGAYVHLAGKGVRGACPLPARTAHDPQT